jgi:hypothetical protein
MTRGEAHDVLFAAGFRYCHLIQMGSYDVIIYLCQRHGCVECGVWRTNSASKETEEMCLANTKRAVERALDEVAMHKVLELCP